LIKNCTKRKSEVRIHETLPNGQVMSLYFQRHQCPKESFKIWTVGLYIGSSRKEANRWYTKKPKHKSNKSTGQCGLTGLRRALHYILEFVDQLGFNEELQIRWQDEKRKSAYRYLIRYGFQEAEDFYHMRNPRYWEPKDQNDSICDSQNECVEH
jgi:hypothetical protein